jgi:2-(1,2-epoxy-1,2-dihydrophenyl)acetyl-CoA isomerase
MTAQPPPVLFERRGPIGIVTLNRPQTMNALSAGLVEHLVKFVREMDDDRTARALIVTGAGKGFCSGMDVNDMGTDPKTRQSPLVWPRPRPDRHPVTLFRSLVIPVIVAVNGVAAGAGMSIAMGGDIRIMSDKARFYPIFMRRGLMPDMGLTYTLTKAVGTQKALELIWKAEPIEPEECLRLGLVNKVVPHEKLMDEALAAAERFTKMPSMAVALAKRAVYRAEAGTLEIDLESGSFSQERLMRSEDFAEGYKSFLEKREPKFKGQ